MSLDVLYFAPGSGLGHMNRALAVCLELRALGVRGEIVTNSPFAEGLAGLARFPVTALPNAGWPDLARERAASRRPRAIVLDTFPLGLRREWEHRPPEAPLVYMARRLRLDAYPLAPSALDRFALVVVAEPLAAEHQALIDLRPHVTLPGPVRLAPGAIPTPVPPALATALASGRACLIVHGGPPAEVDLLRERANGIASEFDGPPLILSPWPETPGAIEYYPAANIRHHAARVLTGAGYNSMADGMLEGDGVRHIAVPFERRYDDQAARLAAWADWRAKPGGARIAAAAIAALLD